jgi:TRAP-type transport system periplasmic protein
MKKFVNVSAGALAAFAAMLPVTSHAEVRDQKFKLSVQTSLDNARGATMVKFADAIKTKSNGKMTVQIFPSGQLGGDIQTISAMRGGTVDATVTATSTLVGSVKEFALFDLPFLFQKDAEAMAVLDGAFGKRLNSRLEASGLISLGYWGLGYRHLTNSRRPVNTVDDIKGLKIRVLQNPVYIDLWNGLGANAVPLPFPEVYTALEQKTVDGQENPALTVISSKLYEVQKYLSLTQHIYFIDSLLFSKPKWERLNADEQNVIVEAAKEAVVYGRVEVVGEDKKNIDALRQKMTVNEVAPAELERFRAVAKPIIDKHAAAADPAATKELFDSIAQARGK